MQENTSIVILWWSSQFTMLRGQLRSGCQTPVLEVLENQFHLTAKMILELLPKWTAQEPLLLLNWVRPLSRPFLLTSAGTSRLLPRCWLKERHQASVYPFMLGTYFFTVSSFSLSHTPSSLWIYGKTSNRTEHSHAVLLLWKQEEQHPHTHTTLLRLQESQIRGLYVEVTASENASSAATKVWEWDIVQDLWINWICVSLQCK